LQALQWRLQMHTPFAWAKLFVKLAASLAPQGVPSTPELARSREVTNTRILIDLCTSLWLRYCHPNLQSPTFRFSGFAINGPLFPRHGTHRPRHIRHQLPAVLPQPVGRRRPSSGAAGGTHTHRASAPLPAYGPAATYYAPNGARPVSTEPTRCAHPEAVCGPQDPA
jgi:hypothetical protein